jgi:hypothetical protein
MRTALTTIVFLLCSAGFAGQRPSSEHRLADSLQRKLYHIRQNADSARPDQAPTIMTEEEINDYLAAGRVKLPQGVKKITFQGQSGVITGLATIDFDEVRAGQHSSNPLLSIFSGTHYVRVEADAAGNGGKSKVHVRTVNIDGLDVPRMALEFFINKYLKPRYPDVGLDSEFQMPDKIEEATVGYHKLTVTQR